MWKNLVIAVFGLIVVLAATPAVAAGRATPPLQASRPLGPANVEFNRPGNIIIADQFNNRVIEVNGEHRIVWSFGSNNPALCNPGPGAIIGPNDEERVGPFTFMAGTGVPPGVIPQLPNGCVDNRVILVDPFGNIVWQYGKAGVSGSGFNELNVPVFDVFLPNFGTVLIVDQSNERVIEVTFNKHIVWQYGMTGVIGSGHDQLNNPNSAELLPNGHILIADENNNRVIEVTHDNAKRIVWQCCGTSGPAALSGAAFASRLPNGNTLITDSNNSRILEVDQAKHIEWVYVTNARPGSIAMPFPTRAVRLHDGHSTLISDQFNHQVIAVNHAGKIVFAQGAVGVPGNTFDLLYGPYDAKVIGDYTGLTPP